MKKNTAFMRILAVGALGVILDIGSVTLFAAEKTGDKFTGKSSSDVTSPELPDGQNVEKLLHTLNEALQENRKIREGVRNLQGAFEKATLDKSDLMNQIQKVEKLAIQRNKDAGQKIDDLSVQLNSSKKEMEKIQAANKASVEQKLEAEKKLEVISAENTKMQGLLRDSILTSERDQIVELMKKNDKAVQNAVAQVSAMDGENISLKARLIKSYFDLGNMFYDLGRYEDAAVQYLHVLEWDPYHAWAHHNLAVIYDFHLRKIPKATAHYQKYLELKSTNDEAEEARMRLWDLQQLSKVTPVQPLKQDFDKYQRMPRS